VAREVNVGDSVFRRTTFVFASASLVILLIVAVALVSASRQTLGEYGLGFIWGADWDPGARETYGALPFIAGTLSTAGIALLLAVPVSLGIAIFLAELAPDWIRAPMSFVVELLAAVPSVIYGLWGLAVLRPAMVEHVFQWLAGKSEGVPVLQTLFAGPAAGSNILLASLVLAIMILPTISSVSREVLRAVPNVLREGAYALGATRWETLRTVVLPYARSGISGAIILGLGRALGETMAVTMLVGNNSTIHASVLQPGATMASVIANEYPEASGKHLSALTEIGLLLFLLTLALNVVARVLVWRVSRLPGGASRA
jgi:phosphate transport system permease protein